MVRRKWNLKDVAVGAALAATAIGILTFYVWYQTESVKLGLDIDACDQKIRDLEESIEALKVRRATLLDPGRVEGIARDKLGLADPVDGDIVFRKLGTPR
ncbi:MAG: Cell division protein FtsL [Candidatus Aminicenantes bacterium]|jgi:cell division protein FtsL|nr:Cell division protein FtsL [Candidatus Aminicenantes bacterium]